MLVSLRSHEQPQGGLDPFDTSDETSGVFGTDPGRPTGTVDAQSTLPVRRGLSRHGRRIEPAPLKMPPSSKGTCRSASAGWMEQIASPAPSALRGAAHSSSVGNYFACFNRLRQLSTRRSVRSWHRNSPAHPRKAASPASPKSGPGRPTGASGHRAS